MATLTPEAQEIFGATYDKSDHLWLRVHFTQSEQSQAAAASSSSASGFRAENRDPEVNENVAPARVRPANESRSPMSVPVKIVVVYHSGYGHTVKIAEAVARGAAASRARA